MLRIQHVKNMIAGPPMKTLNAFSEREQIRRAFVDLNLVQRQVFNQYFRSKSHKSRYHYRVEMQPV